MKCPSIMGAIHTVGPNKALVISGGWLPVLVFMFKNSEDFKIRFRFNCSHQDFGISRKVIPYMPDINSYNPIFNFFT